MLGWSLIAVASTAVIIPLLYGYSDSRVNRLLNASFERFTTVIDSSTYSGQDGSLNWRMIENQHALSTIISNPLIGIGMGVNYRPWDPRIDVIIEGRDFRAFIHNGHLKIMLDSGLVGYICLMGLSFIFMKRDLNTGTAFRMMD
ncbi:MAG: O-antigen ligase family protein [Anaerolineales bacterium]|nr:O-antigen ligase family protein [Anaerolineales bacterium]